MRIYSLLLAFLLASSASHATSHVLEKYEPWEANRILKLGAAFGYLALKTGLRGTHSKGSCANAVFTVKDGLPQDLQVGMFAKPGVYPARVRFANAASKVAPDNAYDGRALSIAVALDEQHRQDFVLQNSPIFPIPSLEDFVLLLDHVKEPQKLAERSDEDKARLQYMLEKGKTFTPSPTSYLTEVYWSGTAFALGEDQAVKYKVVPCAENKANTVPGDNYLQEGLAQHLSSTDESEAPACFDFRIQPLKAAVMLSSQGKQLESWEWVENPTLEWNEAQAPSYSVGTLTLEKGSLYSPEQCNASSNAFAVMGNSLPEHRGVGRINRGRGVPETSSRVSRSIRSSLPF